MHTYSLKHVTRKTNSNLGFSSSVDTKRRLQHQVNSISSLPPNLLISRLQNRIKKKCLTQRCTNDLVCVFCVYERARMWVPAPIQRCGECKKRNIDNNRLHIHTNTMKTTRTAPTANDRAVLRVKITHVPESYIKRKYDDNIDTNGAFNAIHTSVGIDWNCAQVEYDVHGNLLIFRKCLMQ